MSVKVIDNTASVLDAIKAGAERAILQAKLVLQRDLVESISKPGKGRLYAKQTATGVTYTRIRNRAGATIKPVTYARVRRSRGGKAALRKLGLKGAYFTRQQFSQAIRNARANGVSFTRKDRTSFWRASAPGDPPAVRTGHLRRSWQVGFGAASVQKSAGKYSVTVGSNVQYAAMLEFGTGRMAARPYVRPAAERLRAKFSKIVSDNINAALVRFRGKR